jgi:uncharacterized protein YybS (DUF2232 family)
MVNEEQAGGLQAAAPKGFAVKDVLLGIIVSSGVFLTMGLLPSAGIAAGIFVPFILMYFHLKLGRIPALLILTASMLVIEAVALQAGLRANLVTVFMMGSSGLILAEFLKRNFAFEKTVFYAVLIFVGMGVFFLGVYSFHIGEQPWNLVQAYVTSGIKESINSYAEWGISQEQVNLIRNNADLIARTVYHLLPAFAIMGTILFLWINVLAGRLLLSRRGMGFPEFGDLSLWKIPDQMVWYVIASAVLILIPVDRMQIAGLNLLFIFLFVYLFQGLSIINFFFQRKKVPVIIRGVFYFLIFAQHFLLLLVICLGFFDIWIDFRRLNKIAQDPSESTVES